jgi:glycosyltransferase involved in cell wall biosynthesis
MGKIILCYLGAINVQDGVDNLLTILNTLVYTFKRNNILLLIIGDGDYLKQIKKMVDEMDLADYVYFTGYISGNVLNKYLSSADIFVDGAPSSLLNDSSTFIKHMEYMIFRKPVVSYALKESMVTLQDAGIFVKPNDVEEMAKNIIELIDNKSLRDTLSLNAGRRAIELSWGNVSKPLLDAYSKISSRIH